MTKHFGIYFLFIAFLLISASNLIAQERTNRLKIRERKSPSIGTVVKDFSLKTADGNTFTLSDYRSKIVVLEFGACTWPSFLSIVPEMDKLAVEFEDKGVLFYSVYTTEPYETEMNRYSKISDKNQTKTHDEYVDYALEIIKEESQKRPILIDFVGPNFILKTLGAMNSNSLIVIDKEGKVALWQEELNIKALRAKLKEMTKK